MPRLTLHLLGPPQFELDGATCDLHAHKALALLAYLAVTNQPHSRAKLATLFWPDQNESRALAYLRHTLWTLRKAVGDELFDGADEWVRLQPQADCWLDVTAFQEHLAACRHASELTDEVCAAYLPQLQAAVDLYRDDFLAGFSLRDSPTFDEWQFFQSEHLRQQLAIALQQLVEGHSSRGDYLAAVPYARRWLALDPMHEAAHQRLLQLYAWSGQRAAALRQYRECRRILREELDTAPAPQTQALYQQVQAGALPAPQPALPFRPADDPGQTQPVSPQVHHPASAEYARAEDELRFVTALCAGLVDEPHHTDPLTEPPLDVLAEQSVHLFALLEQQLAPYQVQAEQVLGGTVLALFGVDAVHEDDAERALHAAFAIQNAAANQQLPVSIGIASGLIYVGAQHPNSVRRVALGSVITLATRLQSHVAPGVCVADKTVYRQARGVFRLQACSLRLLESAEPVTAYQLQGQQAAPRKVRGIEWLHAQLVGRSEELARLHTLARHARQGDGQLAAIIGEAGVGKSRLALEFHAQLPRQAPGWLWLEGRCQELAQNTGYAPLIDLLRSYWGWRPEEDEAARVHSITTLLTELSEDRQLAPERVGEIGALLGRLFGLHFGDARERLLDQVDGVEVHRRTAAALCDLLVALAQRQPLVLVLEDLHWADTLSLELINLLMAHLPHTALLLLCIYRPEQQHRAWQLAPIAARKCPGHFSQLMLNELTPGQSRLLIANLLGTTKPTHASAAEDPDALAPAMLQLILEKGQGNPLYLEELIYALIDSGHLLWEEGRWHVAAAFKLSAIPESLQSIIYSRLDALGSPWKQVVQQAAVIGRTFRRRLLAELISPAWDLDAALQRLSEAAFLYQERLFPEEEYSFRHVLVQEAIYHGLVQRQQRQLHQRVAESIEQLAGARLQDQIDLLAYHWSQAGEPAEAIHYLLLAGDKAQAALAYPEAADYYRRAVGFLRQQADVALTAGTLLKLGNSCHSAGEFRRARQAYDDAFALNQQIAAPTASAAPGTHTLRLAWGEPHSVDPIHTGGTIAMAVVQQLFSPLVTLSPAFEIIPAVAQRWEVLQAGRRYIFHLRQDARWSDGAPVTAHDYALTLRRILAPATADNMASLFYAIKHGRAYHTGTVTGSERLGIAVIDNYTLLIDLEQPASYFLQSLTCAAAHPTPAHLFAAHGAAWSTPGVLVANGPFQLAA